MTLAFSAVLAAAVASYDAVEPEEEQEPIAQPKRAFRKKAAEKPIEPKSKQLPGYHKGTINSQEFLSELRNCGMRLNDKGTITKNPIFVREDESILVAKYIGYDLALNHGTQLDAARRKATLAANRRRGVETPIGAETGYKKSAMPSLAGFVSGIPDETRKRVLDLLGRERVTKDLMVDLMKQGDLESNPIEERNVCKAKAQLERERLCQIRNDLADMGY